MVPLRIMLPSIDTFVVAVVSSIYTWNCCHPIERSNLVLVDSLFACMWKDDAPVSRYPHPLSFMANDPIPADEAELTPKKV